MLDLFKMNYNYQSKYLVAVNKNVHVYKYEKGKVNEAFLFFRAKNVFIDESLLCQMTKTTGARSSIDYDGSSFLVEFDVKDHISISGFQNG